ncbi:DUF3372 domain-containing protein [Paucibacter sp. KBW04]|nr:DUF3372 domain-containing protein [Paucibacter sp. KBW04]
MAVLASVWLWAAGASATDLAALCDGPPSQLLQAAAQASTEARAYWLDRQRIQWPGEARPNEPQTPRYMLYASSRGQLSLTLGGRVDGAELALALMPDTQPLPAALGERFKFIAPGARLRLADADVAKLPALLKGQVLLVRENASGAVQAFSALQTPGALDDAYADAAEAMNDWGVRLPGGQASSARFRLWAPTAQSVHVCLYAQGDKTPALASLPMQWQAASGSWTATAAVPGAAYYRYAVQVWVPGLGLVLNRVTDPYSVSLGANSQRSLIAELDEPRLKPPGWAASLQARPAPLRSASEMSVYELHVRDFSVGDASVPAALRGKYLAFTQPESRGMRHLRALAQAGLTDVHLLPVFDIATIPERGCKTPRVPKAAPDSPAQQAAVMALAGEDCFNWGYDPWHYSAPEGSYASDAAQGERRVLEFRQMVQALHQAGLRVGMDVVYNHTSAAGQDARSVLDRIVPGYYQRLDAKGAVEHSTCCANTATEHRMMAKLMSDSVLLWAREYGIDSFRFDLMAHQPRAVMEALQARLRQSLGREIQLMGEGWNFGEVANGARFVQASQLSLNGSGIATFSDRGRDAARGGNAGDSGLDLIRKQGWLNGLEGGSLLPTADLIRVGLAGSLRDYVMEDAQGRQVRLQDIAYGDQPAGYVSQPGEVVNYVENHDNQTLFDINVFKLPPSTSAEERARVQVLGLALTAFSQGVAYFHAGVDVLRSKSLDRNSYDSGDWFNRLDWTYRDNGFAAGLPPRADNEAQYSLMAPLLREAKIVKPRPQDIAWTRDAFRDLLRIRASSSLFRLASAEAVGQRLRFLNTGPTQNPRVMVARLDGQGEAGAGFKRLLYFINAAVSPQTLVLPEERGRAYLLHPVHLAPSAADRRPAASARYEASSGRFELPARSALVFVEN